MILQHSSLHKFITSVSLRGYTPIYYRQVTKWLQIAQQLFNFTNNFLISTIGSLCIVYSDRVFVVITQLSKFGTIMKAWAEPKSEGGFVFQVSTIMGKRDDPLLHIYARQILERLSTSSDKPLLLSLSLKPDCRDAETFQEILNQLFQNNAWNA